MRSESFGGGAEPGHPTETLPEDLQHGAGSSSGAVRTGLAAAVRSPQPTRWEFPCTGSPAPCQGIISSLVFPEGRADISLPAQSSSSKGLRAGLLHGLELSPQQASPRLHRNPPSPGGFNPRLTKIRMACAKKPFANMVSEVPCTAPAR